MVLPGLYKKLYSRRKGASMKTASFKIIHTKDGNKYRFFCEACGGAVCTTKPIRADTPEKELQIAWESEGKKHFNLCHCCGKWICDAMYNADTLSCVDCTPWEDPPDYCPNCGCKVPEGNTFCNECGIRLMYGGESG